MGTAARAPEKARKKTDEKLANERDAATAAVEGAPHPKVESRLKAVRADVDRAIEDGDDTQEAVQRERAETDRARHMELRARQEAFIDVLEEEREETDRALDQERTTSDVQTRTRDEMLAIVSHDLRHLIAVVGLKAELLQRQLPSEAGTPRTLAEEIMVSCRLMERWASDLVDLAVLDSGQVLHLSMEENAPARVLREAAALFRTRVASKGILLSTEVEDHLPMIRCDRDRIVQVLNNLIGNATKFSPRGGRIRVRVEHKNRQIRYSVTDDGPGIAVADHERIFDRSWHTHQRAGGGAGLGLYISKTIIEAHGGKIGVESEEGAGSTVFFTLPVAPTLQRC